MKILEEKSFPRGGKKPIIKTLLKEEKLFPRGVELDSKRRKNLSKFKTKNKIKEQPKEQEHVESDESELNDILGKEEAEELRVKKKKPFKPKIIIKTITNKTVSEGLVVLGCIGEVNEFEIKVNLPGRILAYVPISDMSDPYNNVLQEVLRGHLKEPGKLAEMYKVGQFVIAKIEKLERCGNSRNKLTLTLNPSKIHSDWTFKVMKKGLVLSAAVRSIEDHGYVMDFGIPSVRAFLKKQNAAEYEKVWNDGRQLAVGQVVHCLVTKSNVCENYCTVEVTLNPNKVTGATLDNVSLSSVVPGMHFNVQVKEVTQSGLVVRFAEDMTGYVHVDHLKNCYTMLDSVEEGHVLSGRVLYIEPYTKHVYFTLRESICEFNTVPPSLQRGCVIHGAKVVKARGGALLLKLKDQEHLYGIVTLRHLQRSIEALSEMALDKKMSKTYPLGSRLSCRLLGYDYMLQVFTCTLKKALLKQPYLNPEDCKPGDVVECIIQKAAPRGIQVSIGTVLGFVDPLHFADVPVSRPEIMFPENKKVKAKILKVSKSSIELTLRSSLINSSSPILHNYEDAEEDKEYDGMVVDVKSNGCLVKFYGNALGWLKRRDYFMGEPPQIGQVIKCKVYYSDPDEQRMLLRLAQDVLKPIKKECNLKLGHIYNVTVSDVLVDGLVVSVKEDPIKGIIPAQQLTDCKQLGFSLCETYKSGDKLRACCLSIQDNVIFSISPTFMDFFESRAGKDIAALGAKAVTKYMAIPTLIMQITQDMLVVDVPVQGINPAFVLKRNVCDGVVEDFNSLNLEIYQTLVVKFVQIMPNSNSLVSSKLSSVWNRYVEDAVKLFQGFLGDVEKITEHLAACGEPLAELYPGAEVQGIVISCSDMGALMRLSGGVDAVVPPEHYNEAEVHSGMRVTGTVMFVDVINSCVNVTLREEMRQLISSAAMSVLKSSDIGRILNGDVLLTKPNLMLICLHDEGKSHLAFVPSHRHINDLRTKPVTNLHNRYVIKLVKGANVICVAANMDITKENLKRKDEEKKLEDKKAQTHKGFPSSDITEDRGELSEFNGRKVVELHISENTPKNIKKRKRNLNVSADKNTAINEGTVLRDEADESTTKEKRNSLNSSGDGVKKTKKKKKSLTASETEETAPDNSNSAVKKGEVGNTENKRKKSFNVSEEDASLENVSNEKINMTKKKKKSLKVANCEGSVDDNDSVLRKGNAKEKKKNCSSALGNSACAVYGSNEKLSTSKETLLTVLESEAGLLKGKKLNVEVLSMTKKGKKAKKRKSFEKSDSFAVSDSEESPSKLEKKEDAEVKRKSCLNVDTGFVWDARPEHLLALTKEGESDQSSSEDEKEEESLNQKKKKKRLNAAEKSAEVREAEERLRQVEIRLMDSEKNPQSADDFERLVLSTPNNSKNWIKYMAFHLQATEIEKARTVGERALETIIFREEQEKLNMWMALLNLENLYGTKESFGITLEKAIQFNDDYKVYMQVIQMYADSGKIEELNSLVKMVSKKFKSKKDMWLRVGRVYMQLGHFDKSRQLMQKALLSLEKLYHVEVISRFALMENDNGQCERAETLMENILTSYPKRIDIWNLYVDMLVKSKKIDLARQVLERSIIQKLPLNKLKSLYKKFLKFEQVHGTPEGEEQVRRMAKEHVERSMQALERDSD